LPKCSPLPRLLWLVLVSIIVSACVGPGHLSKTPPNQLDDLKTWNAKGKLGLVAQGSAKSANFHWDNRADNYNIDLSGALGIGRVSLTKNGDTIVLASADGKHHADSPDALLAEVTGMFLPVSDLNYWIKGSISPNTPIEAIRRDEAGNITHLRQQGWDIDYVRFVGVGPLQLPEKIIATRDDLKLTIIIKRWTI